jgi:hypothetical protein
VYAASAKDVPASARCRVLARLTEQDRGSTDDDPRRNPERHRGNESSQRCCDEERLGGSSACKGEPSSSKGEREDRDREETSDAGHDKRARGESPLSILNALTRPAKSNCANGMGIALAAPKAASAAAATRL